MYYYDPDNKSPRRWAMIATAVYGVLLAGSFALVSFDFSPVTDKPGDTILVDFTEPPVPEPPRPPVKVANEPRVHDVAAPVEQTAQVAGKDPVTQTPNPKALFKMNKGGADEPDNAGNPRAPEGEDKASGTGPGLNPDGLDQLDQDLKKRGMKFVGTTILYAYLQAVGVIFSHEPDCFLAPEKGDEAPSPAVFHK